jgi:hypothetical protein
LLQAHFDVAKTGSQRSGDVVDALGPGSSQPAPLQHPPDPGQGNIQAAQISDKLDAVAGLDRVQVETSARPVCCFDQTQALVIPDRPQSHTGPLGNFPDFKKLVRPSRFQYVTYWGQASKM